MHDDDDALAGVDLAAWQPPMPPAGTADAVIARMREPTAAAASMPAMDLHDRPSRRAWWISGLALVAAAIVALAAWGVTHAPHNGHGEVIAVHARHLDLDGSIADLDAGAQVQWERDRHRIIAHQTRGTVRWTIAGDDTLVIDSGGPGSAATVEASGASLRMEVQMNLSDMRLLGASTLTAAAVAVVTVVVYAGHVQATSSGQTVNVTPGATIELRPQKPPQEPAPPAPPVQPAEPIAVGATAANVRELEDKLRAADEKIAALTEELAARTADPLPKQPPARRPVSPTVRPTVSPDRPPVFACDHQIDVDDALHQAANQYANGFAAAALALVQKALACKQDARMYRVAATYACAAHDVPTAKAMFAKVPPQFQAGIEQKCQQEGFNLRER